MNEDDLLRATAELQRDDDARSATPRGQALEAPLDDAFRRRLKGRLADSLDPSERPRPVSTESSSAPAAEEATGGKVLRGRFGPAGAWLAPLAVAAGLAFFLLPSTSLDPLPSYEMELQGQVRQQRSAAAVTQDLPEFLPGSTLEITLRPDSAVDEPLEVRAVALPEEGEARGLRFEVQISEQGAVLLRSKVEDLGLDADTWTILVAAARSGEISELDELTQASSGDGTVILRQSLRILGLSSEHE